MLYLLSLSLIYLYLCLSFSLPLSQLPCLSLCSRNLIALIRSIPVTFAASLTNISYLSQQKAFSWLRGFVKTFPTLVAFLSGVLPSLIVWVFFKLVLVIVRALARLQRLYAYSDMESTTRNVFFAFQVCVR